MYQYQRDFIDFALQQGVLQFGRFTLKSGRVAPYFFNAGLFHTGNTLSQLGRFYAEAIEASGIDYNIIFGPAYKGIPLAASATIALATHFTKDIPYVFNRKEKKCHGEGGLFIGAPLKGRLLIVDDVITAGTAVRETLDLLQKYSDVEPVGVIVAIDRQEKGTGEISAVAQIERDYQIPVISLINLEIVMTYMRKIPKFQPHFEAMAAYQAAYTAK